MITEQEYRLLVSYLTLIENDAFICGEVAGTDAWLGAYQRLQSDQATIRAYIKSLTEQNVKLN